MKVLSPTFIFATLVSITLVSADAYVAPDLTQWTKTKPFNTIAPAATPSFVPLTPPPAASHIPPANLKDLLTATVPFIDSTLGKLAQTLGFTPQGGFITFPGLPAAPPTSPVAPLSIPGIIAGIPSALSGLINGNHYKRSSDVTKRAAATCLDSKANDTVINSLFYHGAATVFLCPGAVIKLNYTVFIYSPKQTLTTQGSGTRATLLVNNPNMTCAIFAVGSMTSGATFSNIIVDGNRPNLGRVKGGFALMEVGGDSQSLTISNVKATEPRGWSAIHLLEGSNLNCRGAKVINSQIGPAGNSPNNGQQFRRRDNVYLPGEWADGISLACAGSTITGNVITDATDGGIVIFGAPGSTVTNNQIISNTRNLLGGINMVDIQPWTGNYTGTVVSNNKLISNSAFMKVGIAVGCLTWQSYNTTWARNIGGSVTGNTFSSGTTGYFGYGISVSGHNSTTVTGNLFSSANFGGVPTSACATALPAPQALVYSPYTTTGSKLQSSFNATSPEYSFLICTAPGAITKSKYTLTKGTRRDVKVDNRGKRRVNYTGIDDVDESAEMDTDFILVSSEETVPEAEETSPANDELFAIRARHVAKVKSRKRRQGIH